MVAPMRTRCGLVVACIFCSVAAGFTQQPDQTANTRQAFLKLIDRPRVPLNPSVDEHSLSGGMVTELISFATQAGDRVPTLLVKQDTAMKGAPAVIVLHGTGGSKEGMLSRLRALAVRGFVAVAIDGRYHGERATRDASNGSAYQLAILQAFRTRTEHPFLYDTAWDVMRLVDYLETRDDVDRNRIGLTGISKGGIETYLAAAADPRIAAAVPFIGVQSFRWALDHGAWDSRAWTLREAIDAAAHEAGESAGAAFMRKFYDRVAPGVYGDFDGPAMLPLIAPRPLLVINGDSDPRTPVAGVRQCMTAAQSAYEARGAADRLSFYLQPNAGHEVTPEADRRMIEWFERWLKRPNE